MKFITSDGVSLFVEKEGKGVPCIYLHGGPGYWSKSFQDIAGKRLFEGIEMIYLDQRGCGRSDLDDYGDYSLERLLQDIEEVRTHFGFENWYVFGHSFGGLLAVNYAAQFPERVKGLILSNITLDMKQSFGSQITKGRELLGLEVIDLAKSSIPDLLNTFYETVQELMEKNLFYKLQFQTLLDKEKLDESDKDFQAKSDFQQYIFSNEAYFQDFRRLTSMITVPVLVLTGKYDHAIGPKHHESFRFKNAVYKVLESGHHPYVDNPIEFHNAIYDFIKGHVKVRS